MNKPQSEPHVIPNHDVFFSVPFQAIERKLNTSICGLEEERMTGRVKVSYAGRPPFWLFFQPEQSVADLETQAIQSLELPSSHDEHGAVGLTFLLDGSFNGAVKQRGKLGS